MAKEDKNPFPSPPYDPEHFLSNGRPPDSLGRPISHDQWRKAGYPNIMPETNDEAREQKNMNVLMTPAEARKFRRKHRAHGALVLIVLFVCAYTVPSLGVTVVKKGVTVSKKWRDRVPYYETHMLRHINCPKCNAKQRVEKPKTIPLGQMKESNFQCPHCDKKHRYHCNWCGSELF